MAIRAPDGANKLHDKTFLSRLHSQRQEARWFLINKDDWSARTKFVTWSMTNTRPWKLLSWFTILKWGGGGGGKGVRSHMFFFQIENEGGGKKTKVSCCHVSDSFNLITCSANESQSCCEIIWSFFSWSPSSCCCSLFDVFFFFIFSWTQLFPQEQPGALLWQIYK